MITGKLTELKKGKFEGFISTPKIDLKGLLIEPSAHKSADNHPDYTISWRSPKGRVLRIGSMWIGQSRAGNTYYSITITGSTGKSLRMNAVRSEDDSAGEWTIVPMAGAKAEPVFVQGQIETLDDGNMVGTMGGYDFDMQFAAVANEYKTEDCHPDYHIEMRSPAGEVIRMGSIWSQVSPRTGAAYLSISFWTPDGRSHRANAVRNADTAKGFWDIIPLAEQRPELVAA